MSIPIDDVTPRSFWIALVPGVALMAWGARLYLDATPDLTRRIDLAGWLVGLDLVHDLLLAPVLVGFGAIVTRLTPAQLRAPVEAALIVSGSVILVGLLPLLGTAGSGNRTIQSIDYAPSISAVLVAIWVVAGASVLRRRCWRPAAPPPATSAGGARTRRTPPPA